MKVLIALMTVGIFSIVFALPVHADSSWMWFTVRPFDILPLAAAITMIVEILGIKIVGKIKPTLRIILVTAGANLLSFALPCLDHFVFNTEGFDFEYIYKRTPWHYICAYYLVLTVVVELPFVYFQLRKFAESKKRLAITIITVNVITTAINAIIERTLCQGSYGA